uniref:Uncharacterized protein n=1 Tax=Panagrellus redivivus TaxID=6233 RepID=A0A7E4VDV4_PANRE
MENRIEIVYTYDLVAIRQLDAKKWSEVIENRMSETTVSTYADSQKSRSIQRSSPALPRFPPSRSATSDNTTRMTTTLILLLHDVSADLKALAIVWLLADPVRWYAIAMV